MKEKLLDALKLKFPGVSETTLIIIATNKAGSVKDEAQIASTVEGITLDHVIQSAMDSKIADANKKAVENYELKHGLKDGKLAKQTQSEKQTQTQTTDDVPEWAKVLIKQNEELAQKVQGFETKTKQQTLAEQLAVKLNEKKIPLSLAKKYTINEEAEIDAAFTEIEATYNEVRQTGVNNTDTAIPGNGIKLGSAQQMEGAVDAWVKDKQTTSSEPKK